MINRYIKPRIKRRLKDRNPLVRHLILSSRYSKTITKTIL